MDTLRKLCTLSMIAAVFFAFSSCSSDESETESSSSSDDTELTEATFTISLTVYDQTSATFECSSTSADKDTYIVFITEDTSTSLSSLVSSYISSASSLSTYSGSNTITFSDLTAETAYRAVIAGYYSSSTYGTPQSVSFSTGELTEAELTVELDETTNTSISVSITATEADKDTYSVFITEDTDTEASSLVSSYVSGESSIETYSGTQTLTFSDLTAGTTYRIIAFGWYESETYGTPAELTATTDNVVENTNWSVSYGSKYYYSSYDTYYDLVKFTCNDGLRYIGLVYEASSLDGMSVSDILSEAQDDIDYLVEYYETYGYDYISSYSYTESKQLLYSGLSSDNSYYCYMFGVESDGTLNGNYAVSDKFTPEKLTASDSYNAWIGTWSYTDDDGNTGTLTFYEEEPEVSLTMLQNADLGVLGYVDVEYSHANGTITILSTNTGYSGSDDTYGDYNIYWYAKVLYSGSYVLITGNGYDVATGSISGTTATLSGCSLSTTAGTYTTAYMGYAAMLTGAYSGYYLSFYYWPFIYIDGLTLTQSEDSTTASTHNAVPSRYIKTTTGTPVKNTAAVRQSKPVFGNGIAL